MEASKEATTLPTKALCNMSATSSVARLEDCSERHEHVTQMSAKPIIAVVYTHVERCGRVPGERRKQGTSRPR